MISFVVQFGGRGVGGKNWMPQRRSSSFGMLRGENLRKEEKHKRNPKALTAKVGGGQYLFNILSQKFETY